MTLRQSLEKQKKAGDIEFKEIPLNYGLRNKEFIIYDKEDKKFSRIFYDNKYRQDTIIKTEELTELEFIKKYS